MTNLKKLVQCAVVLTAALGTQSSFAAYYATDGAACTLVDSNGIAVGGANLAYGYLYNTTTANAYAICPLADIPYNPPSTRSYFVKATGLAPGGCILFASSSSYWPMSANGEQQSSTIYEADGLLVGGPLLIQCALLPNSQGIVKYFGRG
jgi:hypothetical protein